MSRENITFIDEWFDPLNQEHIKAYKKLQATGSWPKGFVPEEIGFQASWHFLLVAKIADCWLNLHDEEGNLNVNISQRND